MYLNGMYANLPTDKLKKSLAKFENNIEFQNLFNLFINLCTDTFEWTGLPETCDARMLEMNLLFRGMAALYKDKQGNIWSYGATIGGMLTKYGYPSEGHLYALNGTHEPCTYFWDFMDNTNANAVLCLDNKQAYPYINYVLRAAYTISDAKRSLQTAARNSKYSYILKCNEEQAKSMRDIYNNVQNNELALIISKDNDFASDNQVFSTNISPTILDELWNYYLNIYDDFKDILGINSNKQSDKKERLIQVEVMGDQQFVENNLDFRLQERKNFCERCNKYLGTNISVDLKHKQEEPANDNAIQQSNNSEDSGNSIQ